MDRFKHLADRWSQPYLDAIDRFLNFAYINRDQSARIYCPCRKCENHYFHVRLVVRQHLRDNGFWKKFQDQLNMLQARIDFLENKGGTRHRSKWTGQSQE